MDPKRFYEVCVKSIRRAKDVEESLKIWCPNPGQEDQECTARYSNWLADMDDRVLECYSDMILRDKLRSNLQIDEEYTQPGGRAAIFFLGLELPKGNIMKRTFDKYLEKCGEVEPRVRVMKLTLRGVSTITVSQGFISAGTASHCSEIFDPVTVIQDFFGRTLIFEGFGTFVYNPLYQIVTAVVGDEAYSKSFRSKPMVTDAAFYISFWTMIEATFEVKKQNSDVAAICALDTKLIKEAIEGAFELECENFGRLIPFEIVEDDGTFWPLVCKKIPWIRFNLRRGGFVCQSIRRHLTEDDPDFIKSLCTCRFVSIVN